ncbi:MAG: proline--tRNA ligase [Candidatus Nanoarchaeia archaeon]
MKKDEKKQVFNVSKNEFSKWYTEIIQAAELADIRYNVKGFLVFQPWAVKSMEKMYNYYEKALQDKGHEPYWFPTVIPKANFEKEAGHIKGFSPEVFWLKGVGEQEMALRPTSETAFYQMFALWIRSYRDLPFKTYQRANVFRYETKATRPFLRSREFHWIEAHCAHESKQKAMKQVREDMQTTQEVLHDIFGLPFIFFERPAWDKFPGADRTFAADVLNPDGKVVQQPSTHLLKQDFAKAFDVKFEDKQGKEKYPWITCYGPAISRIFASVIAVHGDDKGLRFPWKIAPLQVVIVPIGNVIGEADDIKKRLMDKGISVKIDDSDKRPGEKFYYWEMKGVPIRIELGKKEVQEGKFTIFRRDLDKKQEIDSLDDIEQIGAEIDKNLTEQADRLFKNKIVDVSNKDDLKKVVKAGKIARCGFCSLDMDGEQCAEVIEKEIEAEVRGKKLEKEKAGRCVICGKKAKDIAYIARSY